MATVSATATATATVLATQQPSQPSPSPYQLPIEYNPAHVHPPPSVPRSPQLAHVHAKHKVITATATARSEMHPTCAYRSRVSRRRPVSCVLLPPSCVICPLVRLGLRRTRPAGLSQHRASCSSIVLLHHPVIYAWELKVARWKPGPPRPLRRPLKLRHQTPRTRTRIRSLEGAGLGVL